MIAKSSAAAGRRAPRAGGALDRSVFLRPIAHRGLHDRSSGRIENTAPAFLAAIAKNYGIECDLQAAKDGTPMVFHDASLHRLVGLPGPLAGHTSAALARLRYRGRDARILPFADLLDLVGGRVPLLVEVKVNGDPPNTFLDKIARLARAYNDPIALMSFNADVVAELGRLAPMIPRGLIAGTHQLRPSLLAAPRAATRSKMLDRILGTAPSGIAFFAIDVRMLRGARAWMSRHAPELALFSWTIRTARERASAAKWADAPIFEGYEA